jgi:hypothetical protein
MESENTTLSRFIRQTIEFYKKIFLSFFKGLKKYWYISLLLLVVCGVVFAFKYKETNTYSDVKIGYAFNCFNKKYYGDILFDLDRLVASRNYKKLGNLLNLKDKTVSNILSLEARNIVNSKLHEDFTEDKIPFYVHLKVLEDTNITKIQEAITLYLQQDYFSNKQILNRQQNYLAEFKKLDEELITINKLIKPEATDLMALIQLKSEKLSEKNRLAIDARFKENINLLRQFESLEVSKKSQLISYGVKLGFLYVLLVFVFTSFMLWYKDEN